MQYDVLYHLQASDMLSSSVYHLENLVYLLVVRYKESVRLSEIQKIKTYKNYFIIPGDKRDLNYENFYTKGKKIKNLKQYSSNLTNLLSTFQIIRLINNNNNLKELFKN